MGKDSDRPGSNRARQHGRGAGLRRVEVRLALDEDGPDIPHDEVVANLRARAEQRRKARNGR